MKIEMLYGWQWFKNIITYDRSQPFPRILKTMKRLCPDSYMLSINYTYKFSKKIFFKILFSFTSFILIRDRNLLMGSFSYFYLFQNYSTGKMAQCIFWFLEGDLEGSITLKYFVAATYQRFLLISFTAGISEMLKL